MVEPLRQRLIFAFAGCVFFVCNLLVANMTGQTTSPVVAGDYAGVLGPLHLVLHLQRDAAGKLSGSLDSPDQGALGIPCSDFVLSGAQFSFNVPAVHGAYSGTVSADGKIGCSIRATPITTMAEGQEDSPLTPSSIQRTT